MDTSEIQTNIPSSSQDTDISKSNNKLYVMILSIVVLFLVIGIGIKYLIEFSKRSAKGKGKGGGPHHFDNIDRKDKPIVSADSRVKQVMRKK